MFTSACAVLAQVDMFTGEVGVLVSLARLFSTVTQGPQAGRRDAITGLEYHATQPPPAAAASECMHWVSDPQVGLPGWDPASHVQP